MQINIKDINTDDFIIKESEIKGEKIYLVNPKISTNWNKDNVIFRSSVWSEDGILLSAGFRKFFNAGEQPDLFPLPKSLLNTNIMTKLDGSLLIVSRYKGEYIFRTRGTFDARTLENGKEIDFLIKKYPGMLHVFMGQTSDCSILYEWVSSKNKIIISYGDEPDVFLVGCVRHKNYTLLDQKELDELALMIGVKRPQRHMFKSFEDMLNEVQNWKGTEGVVVYSNNDQVLHKVKSAWYLALHHLKSDVNSIEKLLDIWLSWEKPTYQEMYNRIKDTFDFELVEQCKGDISKITDAQKEVVGIIEGMEKFTEKIRVLSTRKEQALQIISAYGQTSRSEYLFRLLDGKEIDDNGYRKLIFQVLNK
jgi:hypothetical protein